MNNDPLFVRQANRWRSAYNPLRGLTLQRAVSLLEMGELGIYADLTWAFRYIEKRNATLRAVKRLRLSAISKLDWDIKIVDELPEGSTEQQAADQAGALREAYEQIDNLKCAVRHLALAEFRGFAHLEKHFGDKNQVVHLEPVPQWNWCRDGIYGPWLYNETAVNTSRGVAIEDDNFIVREVEDPIDEIALICFIRQNLSQKDWDGFIEVYGIPPLFAEMPANVPADQVDKYQAQAEAVIADFRGTLPNGAKIQTVESGGRGTNPFRDHLRYQDELIVLAATSGLLTVLTQSGSGTLAGGAHQSTFDSLAQGEAGEIGEILQAHFDKPILAEKFADQPQLAYFELAAEDKEDLNGLAERLGKLRTAGFQADAAEVSEKFALKLTAAPTPTAFARPDLNPNPNENNLGNRLRRLLQLRNRSDAEQSKALDEAFTKDNAPMLAALGKLVDGEMSDADLREFQNRAPELLRQAIAAGHTTAELEKIFGTAAINGLLEGQQDRAKTLTNRLRRAWRALTRQ